MRRVEGLNYFKPRDVINYKVIGLGVSQPDVFNSLSGGVSLSTGVDRINQSIRAILSTRKGERFYLPEFGCKLADLVFEPYEWTTEVIRLYTVEALEKWEKRIKVLSVDVQDTVNNIENSILPISIVYSIVATNVVGNYVYPFVLGGYEIK